MSGTVVLLGDSIIDNVAWVDHPDHTVTAQLREIVPNWTVEMRATDTHTSANVIDIQLVDDLPQDSFIVLSVGGNDARRERDRLRPPGPSEPPEMMLFGEALVKLYEIRRAFRTDYTKVLEKIASFRRPTLVLTIYNPPFVHHGEPPEYQSGAWSGLSTFNDVIQEEAMMRRLDLLDIRHVCTDVEDFSSRSAIEPSRVGGGKIAKEIAHWLHSFERSVRIVD